MNETRSLTSLLTGATAAVIAISSFAVVMAANSPLVEHLSFGQMWLIILLTSVATLLVMSLLHSDLNRLYAKLAENEATAKADARRDPLTGLANRKFLVEQLDARLARDLHAEPASLLFLDLDFFKRVNDTLGHAAGDEVILEVAAKLLSGEPRAVLARLGGDEFALIVEHASETELRDCCDQICNSVAGTYRVAGGEAQIGVSIGAVALESLVPTAVLMRRADMAMYRAKSLRSGYHLFDQAMLEAAERRAHIENRLRRSLLGEGGLSSLYQTIVTPRGEIVAVEALLRWNDAELGIISPAEMVDIAEEARLIDDLGRFMASQACVAAQQLPDLRVCLNLSSVSLLDPQFPERLFAVAQAHQVEPARLELEIAERVFVDRADQLAPVLCRLNSLGFGVTVDNYGTSAGSISHLQKMGVNTVKLDRTMLESTREYGSIAIMRAKVALAQSLDMEVACAGVADAQDREIAVQAGCTLLQGFLFSTPMPLAGIKALVDAAQPVKIAV